MTNDSHDRCYPPNTRDGSWWRCALWPVVVLGCLVMAGCNALTMPFASQEKSPFLPSFDETGKTKYQPLKKLMKTASKEPTNTADWIPELSKLAWADFEGESVRIHNIRNCEYYTYNDCVTDWYDKTFDLDKIKTVDFILIPFADSPSIAHTMLSFGFDDGEQVGISVEVRLEKGEQYDAAVGMFGQFEIIYVVADERDLIRSRTEHRGVDVYLYATKATPAQAKRMFVDMLNRVNQLHDKPEFYDTLSNNCTTNIVRHINHLAPGKVPHDYRVLLPGFSDQLAYDLGLIDNRLPFAETKRRARVNDVALRYRDHPQFSAKIRQELRK